MQASGAHTDYAPRSPLLGQLAGLFRESNAFAADASNDGTGATEIDLEEQAAGYQAAYSKLATAGTPSRDVVAYAGDVCVHVAREFTRLLGTEPGMKTLGWRRARSLRVLGSLLYDMITKRVARVPLSKRGIIKMKRR